jgi:hypothetical protein
MDYPPWHLSLRFDAKAVFRAHAAVQMHGHCCSHLLSMRIGVVNGARCLVTAIEVDLVTPYLSIVSKCLLSAVFHVPVHNPCGDEKRCIGTGCRTEERLTIIMDELLCN